MTQQEIFKEVQDILVDQLGVEPEEITMDANFIDDLNADSLDIVELIMTLEQEFEVSIPDEDAEKISSVADVVNYIKDNFYN